MEIKQKKVGFFGIKITLEDKGKEIGRVFLYLMHNDLHKEPFGLVEDVFVKEEFRGRGHGTMLVQAAIEAAKENKCYKLLCTSRYGRDDIHKWYESLGFKNHGVEFRIDLKK